MPELTLDKVLDSLEPATREVAKLNKAIPNIERKLNEAGNLADVLIKDFQSYKDELQNLTQDNSQKIRSMAKETLAQINETEKKNRQLLASIVTLEKTMAGIKEQLAEFPVSSYEQRLSKIEMRLAQLDDADEDVDDEDVDDEEDAGSIEIDYGEVATISQLFSKYNGKINQPIIVEAPHWRNDYCFLVEQLISEGDAIYAIGKAYQRGALHEEEKKFRADSRTTNRYHMYNGRSLKRIIEAYEED